MSVGDSSSRLLLSHEPLPDVDDGLDHGEELATERGELVLDGRGELGTTVRVSTPLSSSARSFAVSTLAEIFGMSARSSLKRRGSLPSFHTMFAVHTPPSSRMHSVSGHIGGSGGDLFLRRRSIVVVTERLLDSYGYQRKLEDTG